MEKEYLKEVIKRSLPKNNILVKDILGTRPKSFEEILEETGISIIR